MLHHAQQAAEMLEKKGSCKLFNPHEDAKLRGGSSGVSSSEPLAPILLYGQRVSTREMHR